MNAKPLDVGQLVPPFLPDNLVNWEAGSPDWAKTLVIANWRIETVSKAGTFREAEQALDHFQEMGVNGVWLNPVFQHAADAPFYPCGDRMVRNGYYQEDPSLLCADLGTEKDYEEFIKQAHKRNIRVFLDAIPHGVSKVSRLVSEHPDWFKRDENGELIGTWSMLDFDFERSEECRQWYIQTTVDWILKFGLDGIRCDVEPFVSGPERIWREVRRRCENAGRKIVLFSEHPSDERGAFDFEQIGVGNVPGDYAADSRNYYMEHNIAEATRSGSGLSGGGRHRLYTFAVSDHDSADYTVKGSLLRFGYQAIFAPLIPLFHIGEEWNNDKAGSGALYCREIRWEELQLQENRTFFEAVKKLMWIRRSYPEIFQFFPEDHRQVNLAAVPSDGPMQAYARYKGKTAILIVPNPSDGERDVTCRIPWPDIGIEPGKSYMLTDLIHGESRTLEGDYFTLKVAPDALGVIKLEPMYAEGAD